MYFSFLELPDYGFPTRRLTSFENMLSSTYSVVFGMPVNLVGAKDAKPRKELAEVTIMSAEHDLPAATASDPKLVFTAASPEIQKVTVLVDGFQSCITWKYANGHRALI